MLRRLALGILGVLLAADAHADALFSCVNGVSGIVCTVAPGSYTTQAAVSMPSPSFQADNEGSITVAAAPGLTSAVLVQSLSGGASQSGSTGASGDPSEGFQFGSTGPIALNGSSSLGATATAFQALMLQSQGAPGFGGQGGGSGGDAGPVSATITNTRVTLNFQPVAGATYGVFAETVGGQGGGTQDDNYAGGGGGAAGALSLTLAGSTVTSTQGNNPGAGVFLGQTGGNGGSAESQSSANGGAGGATGAMSLAIGGGGVAFTGSDVGGTGPVAAVELQQLGGAGGPLGVASAGGQGGAAGTLSIQLADTSISSLGAAAIVVNQVGGAGGLANKDSTGGAGGTTGQIKAYVQDSSIDSLSGGGGLLIRQVGGAGGDGDTTTMQDRSNGGPGGTPGGLALQLSSVQSPVSVSGSEANVPAILAQSSGGAGGTGATTGGGLQSGIGGGNGGAGGAAGPLSVSSLGAVAATTAASDGSPALAVVSQGGKGGDAGLVSFSLDSTAGIGGPGGGGSAANLTLGSGFAATTGGVQAPAVLVASRGGQGGAGGEADGEAGATGGVGGAGGAGGTASVVVKSGVTLETTGARSAGLLVQSIGGAGGAGGSANGGLGAGDGGGGGGGGAASAASGGAATVETAATIGTTGQSSAGILVQAIAGGGGAGGLGSGVTATGGAGGGFGAVTPVTVVDTGSVTTAGAGGYGLLVQSVAGGGGTGGAGSGFFADPGAGGTASNSGTITINQTGAITTAGDGATAILAQSIGGGGGTGGVGQGIFYSKGGSGAAGGNGGIVTVNLGGHLATSGILGAGVKAQSIGGGGGDGGNVTNDSAFATVAIGGSAGAGGGGGAVTLNASGAWVTTTATGAPGALAQSIGGGGGAGGAAYGVTAGALISAGAVVGGSGGVAGRGGAVVVSLGGTQISTGQPASAPAAPPVDSFGVLAQSIGGGGGLGGGASAYTIVVGLPTEVTGNANLLASFAAGGSGGAGGGAGTVQVDLGAGTSVSTGGVGAIGVLAQSIGGGGGSGGDSSTFAATIGSTGKYLKVSSGTKTYTVDVAVGGAAGGGGAGSTATLDLGSANGPQAVGVTTHGDDAPGLVVQSIGGGGGNAGMGSADVYSTGNTTTVGATVTVGAIGGSGGAGAAATANLYAGASVATSGSASPGLIAQSIGGGGGIASGGSIGLGAASTAVTSNTSVSVRAQVGLGANGGTGNTAGTVSVLNQGAITTVGNDSPGILAQSVGGGGGLGGTAGTDSAATSGDAGASTAQAAGTASQDTASGPTLSARFDLALNVGGTGGSGGAGGEVDVTQQGSVATSGDYAPGILAQSVGGGGGKGGIGIAGSESNTAKSVLTTLYIDSNVSLGFGGSGGSGNDGGKVTVTLGPGSIVTGLSGKGSAGTGWQSYGVLAQSVGGGGGAGADGTAAPGGAIFLGAAVSGGGGAAGDGGPVTIGQAGGGTSTITTYGEGAHAIVAQSVGDGGGVAGSGGAIAAGSGIASSIVQLSLGGRGSGSGSGSSGNGGAVLIDFPGPTIRTAGADAFGMLAQSVGGGGGIASTSGAVGQVAMLGGTNVSGNGGAVTAELSSTGSIATTGIGSHGIVAQSVGGGGGIALLPPIQGVTPSIATSPSGLAASAGSGAGGDVAVQTHGPISVSGAGAFGILAQSVSNGGGLGTLSSGAVFAGSTTSSVAAVPAGGVTIVTQATIAASGANGVGIFAQSVVGQASAASGPISILVQEGLSGGAVTGGSADQGAGIWVLGGSSQNSVVVDAGASVGAASGLAITYSGSFGVGVTNQGTVSGSVNLGGGTMTNAGTEIVAGPQTAPGPYYGRAVINGRFVQTDSGRIVTAGDFAGRRAGTLVVNGTATLAGTLQPVLASILPVVRLPVVVVDGAVTGQLAVPGTALFDYAVQPAAVAGGTRLDLVTTGARYGDPRFGLDAEQHAVAAGLQGIFDAGGSPALATFNTVLDTLAGTQPAQYRRTLAQLGPRSVVAVGSQWALDAATVADMSMSCPVFAARADTEAFLTEGSCGYLRVGGRSADQDGTAAGGTLSTSAVLTQVGGQTEVRPGWFLGGSLLHETSWLQAADGLKGQGEQVQAAVTLKRQEGPWLFTGALFGGAGSVDLERPILLPGFFATSKGSPSSDSAGGRVRVAYTIGRETIYVRPFINVDAIYARLGGFREYGAGSYGLVVAATDQTAAVATPAVELGQRTVLGPETVLRTYVSAGASIRSDDRWRVSSRLAAAPAGAGSFATTLQQDQVTARVGFGVQLFSGRRLDLRAQYDGQFGRRTTASAGSLVFAYRF